MTVGKTRDAGWQVGVSRTLNHPLDQVWTMLVENPDLWLAPGARLPIEAGQPWTATNGTNGELRTRHEHDRVRLTMQRPDAHESTVQVTVRPSGPRTTVRFHQERMRDADERATQHAHWQAMLDRLAAALDDCQSVPFRDPLSGRRPGRGALDVSLSLVTAVEGGELGRGGSHVLA